MDEDIQHNEESLTESICLENEILDLRKETSVLIKDIAICENDHERLVTENHDLGIKILQKTESLTTKLEARKKNEDMEELINKIKKLEEELRNVEKSYDLKVRDLNDKNSALEDSLDLMRDEFEQMENYWQKKIEDERKFYDKQIEMEAVNFRELQQRILEYEERLSRDRDQVLYTIMEDPGGLETEVRTQIRGATYLINPAIDFFYMSIITWAKIDLICFTSFRLVR